jgi:hypothetical protein
MFGKGIFINTIKSCSAGSTSAIAANAAAMGLNFIAVKIARGWFGYNYRKLPNGTWLDDYIPMLRDDLAREGIDLWGWGSCWLLDGDAEASTAVERVQKFDLKAFLIDAEAQAKISPDRVAEASCCVPTAGRACIPNYPGMNCWPAVIITLRRSTGSTGPIRPGSWPAAWMN